jgi:DNA-binding XRE family transcriptional regulator
MKKVRRGTTSAIEILHKRFYEGCSDRLAALEQARADDQVAREIQSLRQKVGLTQKQLAALVGTTPSAISRLEDADYEGHSMAMLRRIAAALHRRVEIRFVPVKAKLQAA